MTHTKKILLLAVLTIAGNTLHAMDHDQMPNQTILKLLIEINKTTTITPILSPASTPCAPSPLNLGERAVTPPSSAFTPFSPIHLHPTPMERLRDMERLKDEEAKRELRHSRAQRLNPTRSLNLPMTQQLNVHITIAPPHSHSHRLHRSPVAEESSDLRRRVLISMAKKNLAEQRLMTEQKKINTILAFQQSQEEYSILDMILHQTNLPGRLSPNILNLIQEDTGAHSYDNQTNL
ncbi:MAG: hypothetical protein NTX86_00130 [Candidatus Dependentiae bacterium]|nr:hypothetical protein [Candidatus Dependentiae bacterium]